MTNDVFLKGDLIALRKELGLTQQVMADRLDMAIRSYQSIESGESEYRYIHRLAAERVALAIAVDKNDPSLAPASVRQDALELVRVGQLLGKPEFSWNTEKKGKSAPDTSPRKDEKFKAAYAVIGELILIASALDHQLNHVLMQVLSLSDSPLLESVVATLDTVRKIEMLKARSKHIAQSEWRKPVLSYLEKLQRVSKWRNLACHTVLIPDDRHDAVFVPTAAAKLLNTLELGEEPSTKRTPIADVKAAIKTGEIALGDGLNLIENFTKMNTMRVKRFGK
jgi:transcriptional regulator with XRE-family HTH domain